MAKPKQDERDPTLIDLTLEQLNHEKALLKVKMRENGKVLSAARKDAGDLNERYEEIDKEMLRRDKTYKQLELQIEEESEE